MDNGGQEIWTELTSQGYDKEVLTYHPMVKSGRNRNDEDHLSIKLTFTEEESAKRLLAQHGVFLFGAHCRAANTHNTAPPLHPPLAPTTKSLRRYVRFPSPVVSPDVPVPKFTHIESQIEAFAVKFGIPVSVAEDLLTQELLSDEASGPEDEKEETFAAWKDKHFLEVLECLWRSDQLSLISSSTQTLYADAVNTSGINAIKYTRVPTPAHRQSSRIPRISPWDFGISSQWLEEQRSNPEVAGLLSDWGTHGNPEEWKDISIAATTGAELIDQK
ncbi:hypothetical protein B0H14DRAFT_3464540 [Mycena olivaceomarginata]|nr:hypothetical protein B0H14DRAFT_3464540 [Mycena olivaceomarginata]